MFFLLEQRVAELEKILGINENDDFDTFNVDVSFIRNKLNELNLGFILNIPIKKLQRLKTAFSDV